MLNTLRYVGKDGREIIGMPIPDALLTDTIKSAPYYSSYLEHVTEYQRYLNKEHDRADDKSPEPALSQPPKPTPTPTESSKKDQGKKCKLVMESTDAPSLAKRSKAGKITKKRMPKSSLQLVDEVVDEGVPEKEPGRVRPKQATRSGGRSRLTSVLKGLRGAAWRNSGNWGARPVISCGVWKLDSGRIQPLPDVYDAELALTDSEMEFDEEAPEIHAGDQDEGQAGPNPGEQDEGQAGPNPVK
ncbi:hypothetical protein Tco_1114049 [Tanacetum coccineum]|uniref:Histone deacetylase 14 n=1 Tax=Tanacetum coccineum TaxID=301880 RepID=A0ABQ5IV27_9ASTR